MLIQSGILGDEVPEYLKKVIRITTYKFEVLIEHRTILLKAQYDIRKHTSIFEEIATQVTVEDFPQNGQWSSLQEINDSSGKWLEHFLKEGDGPKGVLLDRLMSIRFETWWATKDISQMRETVVVAVGEFEEAKFKVDWIGRPDEKVVNEFFYKYDEFHGFPKETGKR